MTGLILVRINCPDQATAYRLSDGLLDARLTPCTNTEGPITSAYRWEGETVREEEWLLWVKARPEHWPALRNLVAELHPHDVPAILAIPVQHAPAAFAQWVVDNTGPKAP